MTVKSFTLYSLYIVHLFGYWSSHPFLLLLIVARKPIQLFINLTPFLWLFKYALRFTARKKIQWHITEIQILAWTWRERILHFAQISLLLVKIKGYHPGWCPSVWRSSLFSSQAWTHPRASSSQTTPSYIWPGEIDFKDRLYNNIL